jgi:hypothetical protein
VNFTSGVCDARFCAVSLAAARAGLLTQFTILLDNNARFLFLFVIICFKFLIPGSPMSLVSVGVHAVLFAVNLNA